MAPSGGKRDELGKKGFSWMAWGRGLDGLLLVFVEMLIACEWLSSFAVLRSGFSVPTKYGRFLGFKCVCELRGVLLLGACKGLPASSQRLLRELVEGVSAIRISGVGVPSFYTLGTLHGRHQGRVSRGWNPATSTDYCRGKHNATEMSGSIFRNLIDCVVCELHVCL